jgi:hypothetical protein
MPIKATVNGYVSGEAITQKERSKKEVNVGPKEQKGKE